MHHLLILSAMVCLLTLALMIPLGSLLVAADPIHITLQKRTSRKLDLNEISRRVKVRYGFGDVVAKSRRASTVTVPVTNQDGDASFFASLTVGTPPQNLGVILDTGSSDLWFVGTSCIQCSEVELFESSKSSSFVGTSAIGSGLGSEIVIQYGSGAVQGTLGQDTISMGGFTVTGQKFLTVDAIQGVILDSDPTGPSGLMGLAFASLAKTQATPFWEALVNNNQFSSPEMAFWLARSTNFDEQDVSGGAFTLGGTNSTLFTGDIEFLDMPTGTPLFWTLTLSSVTVNGKAANINSGTTSAAIDTGTSLIAGPTADVTALWRSVPGSGPSPSGQGFFNFPCNSPPQISISFGGKSWPISTVDIVAGLEPGDNTKCIGAIFAVDVPANTANPSWIFGDTFLKNVYSVFRATPPSVGFAQLSGLAGGTGTGPSSGTGSAPVTTLFSSFTPDSFTGLPTVSSPSSTVNPTNPGTSSSAGANPFSSDAVKTVKISALFTLGGVLMTGIMLL